MKKTVVLITALITIAALITVHGLYTGWIMPNRTPKRTTVDVEAQLNYVGELTGNELFGDISPEYLKAPEGYKQLKIECSFTNKAEFNISGLSVDGTDNDKIATYNGCLDFPPSSPVEIGETVQCDLYIFIDENMRNEEVKNELSKTTVTFFCYNDNAIDNPSPQYFTGSVQ